MSKRKVELQAQIQYDKFVGRNKLLCSQIKTLRSSGLRATIRDLGKVMLLYPSSAVCSVCSVRYGGENNEK